MPTPDPVAELEDAAADLEAAGDAVEEVGEDRLERLADARDRFRDLLARYEEPASGSGDVEGFQAYLEFQDAVADFVEGLDEDLPERDAFEEAAEILDRRRLEDRDFERARDALAPVDEVLERLTERRDALERYREARRGVEARRREVRERIDHLESLRSFVDADLDAPVEDLREPVEAYNDAVREAFQAFKRDAPAREVLDTLAAAEAFPLVEVRPPPERLRSYLRSAEVGTEPIPTLLEYAGYTRSKLSHYVADPGTFMARVGASRTYLEGLDADALTVEWPPPAAAELRFQVRELIAFVGRFAEGEPIERLRDLRDLSRTDAYGRLRHAARARAELTPEEREALTDGTVADDLADRREEREALAAALETYPER